MNMLDDKAAISEIDERGQDLTAWELDFMESVTKQTANGKALSEKQRAMVERIRGERVAG